MSKRNEKAEFPSEDEVPETPNLIRNRVQSSDKAEYVPDASTSAPEARGSSRGLKDKAEYVELDEREAKEDKQVNDFRFELNPKDAEITPLHCSWLLLVALTDDSETACEKFIRNDGLLHFMVCYDENPSDENLLTLMMATLSNLSEHARLRPAIMDHELVPTFFHLLDADFSISEGAASVLCNLAGDGPKSWGDRNPSRESVFAKIEVVIDTWNPDVQLQFQYNSFKPLLNLVRIIGAPTSQKYALWILKNLLSVGGKAEEYREMLKKEEGKSILEKVVRNPASPEYIKLRAEDLLQKII